jgi:hypothetical protein
MHIHLQLLSVIQPTSFLKSKIYPTFASVNLKFQLLLKDVNTRNFKSEFFALVNFHEVTRTVNEIVKNF